MWVAGAAIGIIFLLGGVPKSTACVSSVHHGTCVEHTQSPFSVLHHEYALAEPVDDHAVQFCHKQCCATHPRCRWWLVTSKPRDTPAGRLRRDATWRGGGGGSTTCALFAQMPRQPLRPIQSTPALQCALGIAHARGSGGAQHVPMLAELLDMSLIRRNGGERGGDGYGGVRRQRRNRNLHLLREQHRLMLPVTEPRDTAKSRQFDGAVRTGHAVQQRANNGLCRVWAIPCAIAARLRVFARTCGIHDIEDEQTTSDLLFFYPFFFGLLSMGACVRLQQDDFEERNRDSVFDDVVRCTEEALQAIGEHPAPVDGTCAICLCDWRRGDAVATLPCQHRFHRDCIVPWLRRKDACPLCNAPVGAAYDITAPSEHAE